MFPVTLPEFIELFSNPSVFFIGFIISCIIYNGWKTSYWYRNGIPGPKPLPLVGNVLDIMFKSSFENELDYVKRYGKIVGVYHGTQPNLLIADPELIKQITVKEFSSFPESFSFTYKTPVEEKFLSNLYGDEWKRVRSLLTPTFTTGKLKKVFELIANCTRECIDNLDNNSKISNSKTSIIDLKHFWGRYNMDVTARCFFALDLKVYSDNPVALTAQAKFHKLFSSNKFTALINMIAPEWFVKLTRSGFFSVEGLTYLSELTQAIISVRKSKSIGPNGTEQKFNDFLQLLVEAEEENEEKVKLEEDEDIARSDNNNIERKRLTIDEIVSSAVIFLIAGYETTSTLLTWTTYELARYPEVQEKLYEEIDSLDEINYETINKCVYLEAVINESLRLHPPVIQLPRKCHSDYIIPGTDGAILPKGSRAFISIYAIHHNPENYPEPHIFKPERFLHENRDSIKPFTFLPFGAGPRLCIGMRFALINAKLALVMFLKNHKLINNQFTTKKIDYTFHTGVLTAKTINVGIERRLNST
ncbi:cytochrome P450 3A56-like [Panonychus citri]|uniref:cytochrome P450 3A56-like n=1 Tax=Panonychus citri TaxID=50023 RepID=UPI002307C01A|nr:cytochrome P450 3A56-like [Panonychus citri]